MTPRQDSTRALLTLELTAGLVLARRHAPTVLGLAVPDADLSMIPTRELRDLARRLAPHFVAWLAAEADGQSFVRRLLHAERRLHRGVSAVLVDRGGLRYSRVPFAWASNSEFAVFAQERVAGYRAAVAAIGLEVSQ